MNTKDLARYGRGGDTKIRKVHGKESHVNAIEADLIDLYGEVGEDMVRGIGSNTINPSTGKKEFVLPACIPKSFAFAVIPL